MAGPLVLCNFDDDFVNEVTATSGTSYTAPLRSGEGPFGGGAVEFINFDDYNAAPDGSGVVFTVPDLYQSAITGTNNHTIQFWVKPKTGGVASANDTIFIGVEPAQAGLVVPAFEIEYSSSGLDFGNGVVVSWVSDPFTSANAGTWAHVAITLSGTTVQVYVNGVSQGTASGLPEPYFVSSTNNPNSALIAGYVVPDDTTANLASPNMYMADLYISDQVEYTTNFTAPTALQELPFEIKKQPAIPAYLKEFEVLNIPSWLVWGTNDNTLFRWYINDLPSAASRTSELKLLNLPVTSWGDGATIYCVVDLNGDGVTTLQTNTTVINVRQRVDKNLVGLRYYSSMGGTEPEDTLRKILEVSPATVPNLVGFAAPASITPPTAPDRIIGGAAADSTFAADGVVGHGNSATVYAAGLELGGGNAATKFRFTPYRGSTGSNVTFVAEANSTASTTIDTQFGLSVRVRRTRGSSGQPVEPFFKLPSDAGAT